MNENSVIFKGKGNGIDIILDDKINFGVLKESLVQKALSAKEFFSETNIPITFKGRALSDNEESELINLLCKHSGLNISYINKTISKKDNDKNNATILTNPKLFNALKNNTTYHKGSIRSGQSLKSDGSLIIVGDVNPGAEVRATGNIVVLGKLKGIVHAGADGCTDCFVAAVSMTPIQLSIANIITYFPEDDSKKVVAEYAYVKNGSIFVEPLIK